MEGSGKILQSPSIQKLIMQHNIPLLSDLEAQKLNWLLQIKEVLSRFSVIWQLCKIKLSIFLTNKKVLLRERKRHTARRVVSTPSVVLPGYPPRGGTRTSVPPPGGTQTSVPPLGGVPGPWSPPGGGTRTPRGGTRTSVPPLPHGILGNVAKHYGIWVPPPCGQTDGWMEGQTRVKTLPSLVLRTRAVININSIIHMNLLGFSIADLTPKMEVECRYKHRIGHKIPQENILKGDLRKWLSSEDAKAFRFFALEYTHPTVYFLFLADRD